MFEFFYGVMLHAKWNATRFGVDEMHECMKGNLLAGEHRGNPRLHDPEGVYNLLGN